MPWIPADKISSALPGRWPETLPEMVQQIIDKSPSVYTLLHAREVVENLIRFDANDQVAIHNVLSAAQLPAVYASSSIQVKMEALTALNLRITELGLDQPISVTKFLTN